MTDSARDSTRSAHDPVRRARDHVLESRAETAAAVLECADGVVAEREGDATASPESVGEPRSVADSLRAELEAEGIWSQLPDVLAGAVRATGRSLSATPVAAPPYVVATSRGPMLRATLDGGRLVILFHVFDVAGGDGANGPPTEYVRSATTPAEAVRAKFK